MIRIHSGGFALGRCPSAETARQSSSLGTHNSRYRGLPSGRGKHLRVTCHCSDNVRTTDVEGHSGQFASFSTLAVTVAAVCKPPRIKGASLDPWNASFCLHGAWTQQTEEYPTSRTMRLNSCRPKQNSHGLLH